MLNQDNTKKSKIALIEDDRVLSNILNINLIQKGYETICIFNGNEVIEIVQNERPSLILLDIILPGQNGLEILQLMKNDEVMRQIPVLITSNLGDDNIVKRGISLGAVDYIIKADNSLASIISKIENTLGLNL
ncbi:response regulator [Patescibacteria group bacterium]|nr:response regulator [Patescibacteria group bacterium]